MLLEDGATHGWGMAHTLQARRLDIDMAVMYRALRRLERDGRVQSTWTKAVAGPRRRLYRITPEGRLALSEIAVLIASIRDAHDDFVKAHEHARRQRGERAAAGLPDPRASS